ncbi:acyl carrier protein [Actinomadura rubrisoli]|uniref:Acyl carrier protein n=1 Tax=Actinomadura rubrisoli TaxID=2530368 RepID=A0A4R5BM12_9ACTN|nr:acyl carrier protein [Actinomadura rubrisoli]TDD87828.1 acyl carrier protein [Actinomadura rubrisoli]
MAGEHGVPGSAPQYLRLLFAKRLATTPQAIDLAEPLESFGLDSLTVAELSVTIQEDLGVTLLMHELSGRCTLGEVADRLAELLTAGQETGADDASR